MKSFKHKISFAFKIKPLVSEEKDKYLSEASLNRLRPFIPNIDTKKNIDLLPFYGNCFVANRINANDDGIGTVGAIELSKLFFAKYCDIEHKRSNGAVGVILNTGFSEFGTDKPLTEEEVKDLKKPFNVCVGGIIWKTINPDLADFLESTNDPSSDNYLSASISWELGMDSINIILLDREKKNFEDGEIITDEKEVEKLSKYLRSYGGSGLYEGKKIGRIPSGEVIPLGIGFVESPAADVKGIAFDIDKSESTASNTLTDSWIEKLKSLPESGMGYQICDIELNDGTILANISVHNCSILSQSLNIEDIKDIKLSNLRDKKQNNISHSSKIDVIENNDNNKNTQIMTKIEKITQLTDENLKECKASVIQELFASESKVLLEEGIKKISEDYANKIAEKENLVKTAQAEAQKAAELAQANENKLKSLEENYNKLVETNKQRELLESFSARMESIENNFELDDKQKEIVANKVKSLNSNEDFDSYMKELEVLLAAKKKDKAKDKMKDDDNDKDEENDDDEDDKEDSKAKKDKKDKKEAKASVEDDAAKAVADALKNGKEDEKNKLPNAAASQESLAEKAKRVFGIDGWQVTNKRANRI